MTGRILFKAENIDVFYGSSQILFGVSIELAEGQTMALLGRNGAGKSTTLKAIAGLAPPRRGRIAVTGLDTHDRKPHLIARAGVGFVPEDRQVFPEHSVEENLEIAAKKGPDGQDYWNLARIYDLFPVLLPLRKRDAGRLSGGEQQMLAIARTPRSRRRSDQARRRLEPSAGKPNIAAAGTAAAPTTSERRDRFDITSPNGL
jgi:branched-chain amino acid transport system ATP-binding protein